MDWNREYRNHGALWGKDPSELAKIAVGYILDNQRVRNGLAVLDIGCGYGRDALHMGENLSCTIHGIDASQTAIVIAREALTGAGYGDQARFQCLSFSDHAGQERYDIVFVSNLYHLLRKNERAQLRDVISRVMKPGGFLFLNTLSANDTEEYGKGEPVGDDEFSFQGQKFFHFSPEEELKADFAFVTIERLYEHSYIEYRVDRDHVHVSWVLIGKKPIEAEKEGVRE